ncbi:unnamed protein product [Trifolium pratense]|uniref:Uncharacterized protein n=1 Tax=Trifolium pratense TaxID=57577 RepID=A0ACB0JFR1_TRIPR|nr:unnamed protein product [Trifolium pratense]
MHFKAGKFVNYSSIFLSLRFHFWCYSYFRLLNYVAMIFPQYVVSEITTPIFFVNATYDSWQVKNEREAPQDIVAASYVDGQYSIPNCIEVLINLKDILLLNGTQFSYALELIKDSKNRVIVVSLRQRKRDLAAWIIYKLNGKDGPEPFPIIY